MNEVVQDLDIVHLPRIIREPNTRTTQERDLSASFRESPALRASMAHLYLPANTALQVTSHYQEPLGNAEEILLWCR